MLSIITTCFKRLDHVLATLPGRLVQRCEYVLVSYGCPVLAHWNPSDVPDRLRIIRVPVIGPFNVCRARNIGARQAAGSLLAFIDADVHTLGGFAEAACAATQGKAWTRADNTKTFPGQCVVTREAFELVRGYDEAMPGYGNEDTDLYWRLSRVGTMGWFDADLLGLIEHGDDRRAFDDVRGAYHANCRYLRTRGDKPINPDGWGNY